MNFKQVSFKFEPATHYLLDNINDNRLKEKGVTLLESIVATAVIAIGFIAIFVIYCPTN